jgi:hypothetical protein
MLLEKVFNARIVYNSKGIVYASSKHSLGIVGEA